MASVVLQTSLGALSVASQLGTLEALHLPASTVAQSNETDAPDKTGATIPSEKSDAPLTRTSPPPNEPGPNGPYHNRDDQNLRRIGHWRHRIPALTPSLSLFSLAAATEPLLNFGYWPIVAGGLALAGIIVARTLHEMHEKLFDRMLDDVKFGRREPLNVHEERFHEELPTLKDAMKEDVGFKRNVIKLETALKKEGRFLEWIGEDADTFSLESALSDLKVAKDHPHITPAVGTKAQYKIISHLILMGHHTPLWLYAHEIMHALHFRALAKQLTRTHLAHILKWTTPDTKNSLHFHYPKELIVEHLGRLEQAHRGEMEMDDLPMATRRFAILLLRQLAGPKGQRAIEAIASRFDPLFGGPKIVLRHFLTRFERHLARPSIWLAGLDKKISNFHSGLGYGNRRAYNQAVQRDLFGSLIPELG